jgi:hypothetical protein
MRKWIAGFALCVGVMGCSRPSTFAKGSGYGVGIPRTNFTYVRSFRAQAVPTAPSERDIGRIERVMEPLAGQVGRVR